MKGAGITPLSNPTDPGTAVDSFLGPGDANMTQLQPCHLVPYLISLRHSNKQQLKGNLHLLQFLLKMPRGKDLHSAQQNSEILSPACLSSLLPPSLKLPHKSTPGSLSAFLPSPLQAQLSGFCQFFFSTLTQILYQKRKQARWARGRNTLQRFIT